MDHLIGF